MALIGILLGVAGCGGAHVPEAGHVVDHASAAPADDRRDPVARADALLPADAQPAAQVMSEGETWDRVSPGQGWWAGLLGVFVLFAVTGLTVSERRRGIG